MVNRNTGKLLLCFIVMYANITNAQTFISPEIVEKYPSSVHSRVYEIALATLIPYEKQIKLAKFLMKKDSLIMAVTTKEKGLPYSKKLIDSLQLEFDDLFDYEETFRYNYFKYKNYFEADAKMNAANIKQKYKTGNDIETALYKLNIARNQRVLRAMITKASLTNLPDSNISFYHKYDSIVSKYIAAGEGEEYFKNKIEELNRVKKLSSRDIEELRKNYQILCLKRGDTFHKNFNAAMQFCISDSIYYKTLYQDSINIVAKKQSEIELDNYVFKYNLNDIARNKIAPILYDKAKRNTWLDTRYAFNRKRDSLQTEINELSWAKIKKELIILGNTQLSRSKFVTAISYKQVLKLSEKQLDLLAEANLQSDIMLYNYAATTKGSTLDNSFYINETLIGILREGQYDSLLQIEIRPQAIANANQNWIELTKYKLTTGLDSASVIQPIISYQVTRLILWERYKYDTKTYDNLTKINRQNKPEILKRLDDARKQDGINDTNR